MDLFLVTKRHWTVHINAPPECSIALHNLMHCLHYVYLVVQSHKHLVQCISKSDPAPSQSPVFLNGVCSVGVLWWEKRRGELELGLGPQHQTGPSHRLLGTSSQTLVRQSPRASRADHQSPACQVEPSEYCTLHQTHPTALHWCLIGVYSYAKSKEIKIQM